MANEIQIVAATGLTMYVVIRTNAGQPYSTVTPAFETYTPANYVNYAVALTEQGVTGYYLGSVPSGIAAQLLNLDVRKRVGGTPAVSDTPVSSGSVPWTGTAEASLSSIAIDGTGRVTVGINADKTGYALSAPEHTAIGTTDVPAGLTAQGYTGARAAFLDTLNGLATSVWTTATSALTTVGSIGKLLSTFTFTGSAANSAAQNLPTDYQQRSSAVTLPTTAPVAYDPYQAVQSIKTQTDKLGFTGNNVNAQVQSVGDKTGYSLTATDLTAMAITTVKAKTDQLAFTGGGVTATASNLPADYVTGADITAIQTAVWAAATRTITAMTSATPQQIATAVWQDLTVSGDFATANSAGTAIVAIAAALTRLGFDQAGNVRASVQTYASGQDPATIFDASPLSLTPIAGTHGEAMAAMRALAKGRKVESIAGNTMQVFAHDNVTVLYSVSFSPSIVAPNATMAV